MKSFIFILLLFAISCNKLKIVDNLNFDGGHVDMRRCTLETFIRYTSMKAQPTYVEEGDTITSEVNAIALGEIPIETLQVVVKFQDQTIFEEETPYRQVVQAGDSIELSYDYNIPEGKGPGKWDIYLQRIDLRVNVILCSTTTFKME